MLAEVIQMAGDAGGLGSIINVSQRRGHYSYILLVLMIIPLVALAIDRLLYWIQRQLFPYQYSGNGLLHRGLRSLLRAWEDFTAIFFKPADVAAAFPEPAGQSNGFPCRETGKEIESMNAADANSLDSQPAALPVGMGQVVNRFCKPKELGLPRVVEFRKVTKTYNAGQANEFTAIKNVDFFVEDLPDKGEFVCILGPSGCGKSTILRMIAGLSPQHPPTTGEVLVQGLPVAAPGADRGMVFQDYTSFDHRSVLENITFGLECRHVNRRQREKLGRDWIEHVGLDVAADAEKYPHELSGGMRQRVAIARTLILRPRIILMDEPFGALDPQTRMDMQDLLVSLWREAQATVFFVTHSIEEAVFLGDRVYVMGRSPGTILQELEVEPPDRPARLMQREAKFRETVDYIRDQISRLEKADKPGVT